MDTLPCSISNYLSGTLQKHTGLSVDIFFSLVLQFGPSQVNLEHIPHCTTDLIGDGRASSSFLPGFSAERHQAWRAFFLGREDGCSMARVWASQIVLHEKALTSAGSVVVSDGTLSLDCFCSTRCFTFKSSTYIYITFWQRIQACLRRQDGC